MGIRRITPPPNRNVFGNFICALPVWSLRRKFVQNQQRCFQEDEENCERLLQGGASDHFSAVGNLRFTAPLFGENYKTRALMVREEPISGCSRQQSQPIYFQKREAAFHQWNHHRHFYYLKIKVLVCIMQPWAYDYPFLSFQNISWKIQRLVSQLEAERVTFFLLALQSL